MSLEELSRFNFVAFYRQLLHNINASGHKPADAPSKFTQQARAYGLAENQWGNLHHGKRMRLTAEAHRLLKVLTDREAGA